MTTIEELEAKVDKQDEQLKHLHELIVDIHKGVTGLKTIFGSFQEFLGLLQGNFQSVEDLQKSIADAEVTNKRVEVVYKWLGTFYTDLQKGRIKVVKMDDDTLVLKVVKDE